MERGSPWTGAGLGALASVPLVLLAALGQLAAGLPFVPYDVFEWTTRRLPGGVVTVGIDIVVGIVTALGVKPTSVAAKIAEKTLAVALFVAGSTVLGAGVALLRRPTGWRRSLVPGLLAGAVWLALAAASAFSLGGARESRVVGLGWDAVLLLSWGAVVAWGLGRSDVPIEAPLEVRAARRSFLRALTGGIVALSAVALGWMGLLGRRRQPRGADAAPEVVGPQGTSGPAASPSPEVLARRIRPVQGTRPEITPNDRFYRIDINLEPPRVDGARWRLRVEGLVDDPLTLSLDEVRAMPATSQMITLECISNRLGGDLIGTSRWTGVRLRDVLRRARMREGARAVLVDAADGFYESVGMADAMDERTLLVYEMNGVPLPPEHGFPLRIYVPDRHGMKLPKWITRLRVSDAEAPGYWVDRGWSKDAIPHTTSVIDTVAMSMTVGEATVLPLGGIAYAGARGISKVEVQADDGPWAAATLVAPPLGPLTWVLWRYDWPYQPGRHTFRVRAYDGRGALQPTEERGPHPDGASGIHSLTARV